MENNQDKVKDGDNSFYMGEIPTVCLAASRRFNMNGSEWHLAE